MGGRKKTGKKEKKLRNFAIPKVFDCEKCSEVQTLHIQLMQEKEQPKPGTKGREKELGKQKVAKIYCVKCKLKVDFKDFQALDQPIDIYNKWCDHYNSQGNKNSNEFDDEEQFSLNEEDIKENEI